MAHLCSLVLTVLFFGLCSALPVFKDDEDPDKENGWELGEYFQGDMDLTPDQLVDLRNGIISSKYHWPHRTVPYIIDSEFTKKQAHHIREALEEYNKKTCLKIRPATEKDENYVLITAHHTGCSSKVGFHGGVQHLNLAPNELDHGCMRTGTIIHEMLHTLGFHHMQCASDRDHFVQIEWDNIKSGHEHNFKKYSSSVVTSYGVRYDYGSVLHYSAYAFSKNGERTIIPLEEGAEIGQRKGLSEADILKLEIMYGCRTVEEIPEDMREESIDDTQTDR